MNITRVSILALGFAGLSLALSQCAPIPPPAPGSSELAWRARPAYRRGYHHGVQDGKQKLVPDHERYYKEYSSRTSAPFERGYTTGFEVGLENAVAGPEDEDAVFQLGREAGEADAETGQKPLTSRHSGSYTAASESAFRRGYMTGFNEVRTRTERGQ